MDYLDSTLHASILSSLAANLASSSSQDDLSLLTSTFSALLPATNGAINSVLSRLEINGNSEHLVQIVSFILSFRVF